MAIKLETWQALLSAEHEPLVMAAAQLGAEGGGGSVDPAGEARLRRLASADLVHAALELIKARQKALAKWPREVAARLVADGAGVEMASSALAGAYKASKFRTAGVTHVLDLCCGVGGDAMALANAGLNVTAIDADPARAWMASVNASCDARVLDIERDELPTCAAFHLDPARRVEREAAGSSGAHDGARRRLFNLDDHRPSPSAWVQVIRHAQASLSADQSFGWCGSIKLGPGVDVAEVRAALAPVLADGVPVTLEYLSERGRLTQAVCWLGALADPRARVIATRLDDDERVESIRADDGAGLLMTERDAEATDSNPAVGKYIIEADACVERAGLLHVLTHTQGWHELHPGLGLLTGDRLPDSGPRESAADATPSRLWSAFEVVETDAWNSRRIGERLRQLGAGIVEVKTRGGACDPDTVQRELRGEGHTPFCVFVLRLREPGTALGGRTMAFITRRVQR